MKLERLIFFVILFLTVSSRLKYVDFPNIWWDEGRYLCEARLLSSDSTRAFWDLSFAENNCQRLGVGIYHPIAFSTLITAVWSLTGEHRVFANAISIIMALVELCGIYLIGKRIANPWVGVFAAALVGFNVHHWFVSFKALNDISLSAFSVMSMFSALYYPILLIFYLPVFANFKILAVPLAFVFLFFAWRKKVLLPTLITTGATVGLYFLRGFMYFGKIAGHGTELVAINIPALLTFFSGSFFLIPGILVFLGMITAILSKKESMLFIIGYLLFEFVLLAITNVGYYGDARFILPVLGLGYLLGGVFVLKVLGIIQNKISETWQVVIFAIVLYYLVSPMQLSARYLTEAQQTLFQLPEPAYYIKENGGQTIIAGSTPTIAALSGAVTFRFPESAPGPDRYNHPPHYSSISDFLNNTKIDFIEFDAWESLQPDYVKNCFTESGCRLVAPIAAVFLTKNQPLVFVLKP